ncbi:hypothetical protein F5051DRAFT_428128 [Lentinula edodes]|nr:hypothetical protein F5051DRAFT_428128 [Lentinula edodes]
MYVCVQIAISCLEAGNREAGKKEAGQREVGKKEAGNREAGLSEVGNREAGLSEVGNREAGKKETWYSVLQQGTVRNKEEKGRRRGHGHRHRHTPTQDQEGLCKKEQKEVNGRDAVQRCWNCVTDTSREFWIGKQKGGEDGEQTQWNLTC